MKKVFKHGSTIVLLGILLILFVPSWRVSFQGWFQGVFMGSLEFKTELLDPIPATVEEWSFESMDGNQFVLNDLMDRPIVLSFWATWCPPCRAELKELRALKQEFKGSIHFISVSEESVKTIEKSGLTGDYDFLYATKQFPRFFDISSYPTLCIINAKKQLVFKHSGAGQLANEKNKQFLTNLIENR